MERNLLPLPTDTNLKGRLRKFDLLAAKVESDLSAASSAAKASDEMSARPQQNPHLGLTR